jgi:hypothetical protein
MNPGRPPSLLPVIGWTSLAGALALLLGGLLGFKLIALARAPGPVPLGPGMPEGMDLKALLNPLEGTLRALSWAQVLLAPALAVVSVEFLKRKAWARRGMEAMNWALALLTAAFPFVVVPFAGGLFRAVLSLGPLDPLPAGLKLAGVAAGLLMTATLEIPVLLTLKALRSPALRAACVL